MPPIPTRSLTIALLAASAFATPVAAETIVGIASATPIQNAQDKDGGSNPFGVFARFTPAADRGDHRLDYSHWDKALEWLVVPMGPSIREGAPRVQANMGTRRIYGHSSRYRLEGNRVAFSFMDDKIRSGITAYKEDLERIGTAQDITRWPRNEQLAFWLNLHNVAVIEALAQQYPLGDTATRTFGSNGASLHDAHLITIKGVKISPRDIREKIVFPNWNDPKVIYGFWRGEIGGPSIQRIAFTGQNVDTVLALAAEEFVNSLRGVERYYGALQVSKIYEESAPFYFAKEGSLRSHLGQFARPEVKRLIAKDGAIKFKAYESDLADLIRGTSDPGLTPYAINADLVGGDRLFRSYLASNGSFIDPGSAVDPAIQRLIHERNNKLNKAVKRGIRTGTVTVGDYDPDAPPKEVE